MPPNPHRASRKRRPASLQLLESLESRLLLTTFNYAPLALLTGGGKAGTGAAAQGLVLGPNGDLYGTAASGGAHGYGLIFKIAAGTDTVVPLASFSGKNGIYPRGGIYVDAGGDVFGTTTGGGADGRGTLFEFNANASINAIETLVDFVGPNGAFPLGGITAATINGHVTLIGVTNGQRAANSSKSTIFEYDLTTNTLNTLAILNPSLDPRGTLVADAQGDIFGTSRHGGKNGLGTLFELPSGAGTITTLASFKGSDGQGPDGGLLIDAQGDIFGITNLGGAHGNGAAFEWVASSSTLTLLASFINTVGIHPLGNLLMDNSGNIYGVTSMGGGHGGGSVYELTPDGTASVFTQLWALQKPKQGTSPSGPLVMDSAGDFIGETFSGGINNRGAVFELLPTTNPQTPIKIVVTQSPRSTIAGHTLAPDVTVEVEDIYGNIVTGDNGTVTLQIHSGPTTSSLTGTVTVNFVNGIATFPGISIDTAGTYTLDAYDGTRASDPTKPFTISPDASTPTLVFSTLPNGTTSHNTTITPPIVVSVEDEFGNVIPSNNPNITLAISTSTNGGSLTGGPVSVAATQGNATFNGLSLTAVGTFTLTASAPEFAAIISDPIIIT